MKELKASTKAGQRVMGMSAFYDGYSLEEVYGRFSPAKQRAYNYCMGLYLDTENSSDFHICSHNSYGFIVAWKGTKEGEDILRVETKDNSYLVWLDR